MFEKEIYNSYIHWLRKSKSIEIPRYYNKVQPGVRAIVSPNVPRRAHRENIDLNKGRNGIWRAPELGKSSNIARFNITENDWNIMGIENYRQLLHEWQIFNG